MMITTNLLARAVDVPGVFVVINYDMPGYTMQRMDEVTYKMRIGRAARFGMRSKLNVF